MNVLVEIRNENGRWRTFWSASVSARLVPAVLMHAAEKGVDEDLRITIGSQPDQYQVLFDNAELVSDLNENW